MRRPSQQSVFIYFVLGGFLSSFTHSSRNHNTSAEKKKFFSFVLVWLFCLGTYNGDCQISDVLFSSDLSNSALHTHTLNSLKMLNFVLCMRVRAFVFVCTHNKARSPLVWWISVQSITWCILNSMNYLKREWEKKETENKKLDGIGKICDANLFLLSFEKRNENLALKLLETEISCL